MCLATWRATINASTYVLYPQDDVCLATWSTTVNASTYVLYPHDDIVCLATSRTTVNEAAGKGVIFLPV